MKRFKTACIYLGFLTLLNAVLNAGVFILHLDKAEFEGFWQIWHPYMIPLLGWVTVPVLIFNQRIAKAYGGWKSRVGKALMIINFELVLYVVVSPSIVFYQSTCARWAVLTCDHPIGYAPVVSWASIGPDSLPIVMGVGLYFLTGLLDLRGRDLVRMVWFPIVLFVVLTVIAFPFGAGVLFDHMDSFSVFQANSLYIWYSGAFVVSWSILLAVYSRRAAGGQFFWPIILIFASLMLIVTSDVLSARAILLHGEHFEIATLLAPQGAAILFLIISFLLFGRVVERAVGQVSSEH